MDSEFVKPDKEFEKPLRPLTFSDFSGQEKIIEQLSLFSAAAIKRNEALDEMNADIKTTSGPIIDKPADLAGLLTSLEHGDILFIDEIHRLSRAVEEYLYSAMEDFVIDIVIDQGPNSRSVRLTIPPFTLIGATTKSGMLSAPMRSRFGVISRLDYYSKKILSNIITRSAKILDVNISNEAANEIALRSRGTPRIANNLLKRARDFAQVKSDGNISLEIAKQTLDLLDIDNDGLDEMDKRILLTLIEKFEGGPVGLNSLSVSVSEEASTLEEVHEPFLIQEGFIKRTPKGRMATLKAYDKFGLSTH